MDARRALKEYLIELECGMKNPEELTVGNYARAWYERRKNTGRYSPLTLKDDELQVRKIEDIWGATLLEDLTLKKISDAYDKLLASKKATKSAIHKIRDPKSEKSHRWLGLDDGTIAFLAEWKQKQARAMEIAGSSRTRRRPCAPTGGSTPGATGRRGAPGRPNAALLPCGQ